jgi:Leucine-rich repeat (LRR) protein
MPDPALSAAVEDALGAPGQSLACGNVCALYDLFAQGGVQTLQGLECAPALVTLTLFDNQIRDVGPLAAVPRLRTLSLANNPLTALVAPFDAPSLERIDLSGCQLTDVSGLAGAGVLTEIAMANNPLASLASFSGLKSVRTIDLSNNRVSSLAEAPALPTLQRLNLSANGATSLLGIERFPALTALDLRDNLVSDIGPLATLAELAQLELSNNVELAELTPLSNLVKLNELRVPGARVREIEALARLQNLTTLDISNNHIADIHALANFAHLRTLYASHNEIQSLAGLSGLTVTHYDFSFNRIQELGSFSNFAYEGVYSPRSSSWPFLNLAHNQISDLTGLANSAGLIRSMGIDVSDNPISCAGQADNIRKLRQSVAAFVIDCPDN